MFGSLDGPYTIITADPPWKYQKNPGAKHLDEDGNVERGKAIRGGMAEYQYPTMTNEAILALPVADLADDPAHLFMWFTNPGMFGGRFSNITPAQIAKAWGFEYRTTLTWVKSTKAGEVNRGGMGWYFRGATEHILYATRGKARIPSGLRQPNVIVTEEDDVFGAAFFDQKGRHSAKPHSFYEMIDTILPEGKRLEMFAREQREGWDVWGNEVTDLDDMEAAQHEADEHPLGTSVLDLGQGEKVLIPNEPLVDVEAPAGLRNFD